jgi:hypothetical protein
MLAATFVVAALHVVVIFLMPSDGTYSWSRDLFDMGAESNLPTWLASVFWFTIAVFAILLFVRSPALTLWKRLPWLLVAGIFGMASLDEIAEIHEHVGDMLQKPQIATGNPRVLEQGSPGSPWILYYAPFIGLAILGMVYFFYRNLSRRYFILACAGFACFVLAIGCDYFQGMWDPNRARIAEMIHFDKDWLVSGSIVVEETLELVGMTLIAWALMGKYATETPVTDQPS